MAVVVREVGSEEIVGWVGDSGVRDARLLGFGDADASYRRNDNS